MPDGAAARAEVTIEPEDTGEARPKIDLGDIGMAAGGAQDRPASERKPAAIAGGILISVVDAATGRPIEKFDVLTGMRRGAVQAIHAHWAQFPLGTAASGQPIEKFDVLTGMRRGAVQAIYAHWAQFPLGTAASGQPLWLPDPKFVFDLVQLRVEAKGYQPQASDWFDSNGRPPKLEFKLVADSGIRGRVVQPDGKPAAGATVAIGTRMRNAFVRADHVVGDDLPPSDEDNQHWSGSTWQPSRRNRPMLAKTDADGRFLIAAEIDLDARVVAVHPSGAIELTIGEFGQQPEIKLHPWGRVEGRVQWPDRPGAGERIFLRRVQPNPPNPPSPILLSESETRCDESGNFALDKVLPGSVEVGVFFQDAAQPPEAAARREIADASTTVGPGEQGHVLLGGPGVSVVGRLVGRKDWVGAKVSLVPKRHKFSGVPSENSQASKIYDAWAASPSGPSFFHHDIEPAADGSLAIPGVLAGDYELLMTLPDAEAGEKPRLVESRIYVPRTVAGQPDRPVNIGNISIGAPINHLSPGLALKPGELFRGDILNEPTPILPGSLY